CAEGPEPLMDRHGAARILRRFVALRHTHERDLRRHPPGWSGKSRTSAQSFAGRAQLRDAETQAGAGDATLARTTCDSVAAAKRDSPAMSAMVPGATRSTPPTIKRARSSRLAGRRR